MKLYHTSNVAVPQPDTVHSRRHLDFGRGFYLTPIDHCLHFIQSVNL